MIFGMMALGSLALIAVGGSDFMLRLFCAFVLATSLVMLWKTTWNYFKWKRSPGKVDGPSSDHEAG
jgi:uncharacterized membrane protein YfcA